MRALLGAELLSSTGTAMTGLALPWFVLETTGSPARTGLVAAAGWAPAVLLAIPAGGLATRLGPRRTMIACDLARAPLVAAVPVLHGLGVLSFALLVALAFAIGVFVAPHLASQRALLPELLGAHDGAVLRANAVLQAANRLPVVLGPALAGALIAVTGPADVLLLDAATFLASAALLVAFVPDGGRPPRQDTRDTWAGVRHIAADAILRPAVVAAAAIELAAQALFDDRRRRARPRARRPAGRGARRAHGPAGRGGGRDARRDGLRPRHARPLTRRVAADRPSRSVFRPSADRVALGGSG